MNEIRKEGYAKLIKKEDIPYVDLATGRGIPIQKPIYDLIFDCDGEEIRCSVSELEYEVVEEGEEGPIIFVRHKHYIELICFADKIKDFKM